jgi:hypothetical protein
MAYVFHPGYWGLSVGYYGGIRYGFGYPGSGYEGGYWNLGVFHYNGASNNFGNVHIATVYGTSFFDGMRSAIHNLVPNRASFNGPGGEVLRPNAQQLAFAQREHSGALAEQIRQGELARSITSMHASVNHGVPPIATTQRAGQLDHIASNAAHHPATTNNRSVSMRDGGRFASEHEIARADRREPANGYREEQFRHPEMDFAHPTRVPRNYSQDARPGNPTMRRDGPQHRSPGQGVPREPVHRDYRG